MLQLSQQRAGSLLGGPRHCRVAAAASLPPCRRLHHTRAAAAAKTSVSASAAPATAAAADADAEEMQHITALLSTLTAPGMGVLELKLQMGDLKLKVVRRPTPVAAPPPAPVAAPAAPVQQQQRRPARQAPAYASMSLDGDDDSLEDESMVYVTANRVGTFKRGRSKAKVGDQVRKGDVLGAIEQLGMLTDVKTPQGGEIVSFKVSDGDPVEYGGPLVCIAPYFGVEEAGVTSFRGM